MKEINEKFDVVIIGAGAAGLLCAYYAGIRGKSVLVLERSNKAGKKILMSGGGKCNFTNLYIDAENYLCPNPHFVKSALAQYTQHDFIALVQEEKIEYFEKTNGQLFCCNSSKEILNMLLERARSVGVTIRLNTEIDDIQCGKQYTVLTQKHKVIANSLVVATGGKSIPSLGGSDFAYRFARRLWGTINPSSAGLVPLTLTGKWLFASQKLSGVSCFVDVMCKNTSDKMFSDFLLFTHRGLSGPAILQISNYWELGQELIINFLPNIDLFAEILVAKREKAIRIDTFLGRYLTKSMVRTFLETQYEVYLETNIQDISSDVLRDIAQLFQSWCVTPSGSEGYRTAEVTLGGVSVDTISSKTMQANDYPGLFFIGEALDVTGQLGGYNFQWAWSSAYVAAQNV